MSVYREASSVYQVHWESRDIPCIVEDAVLEGHGFTSRPRDVTCFECFGWMREHNVVQCNAHKAGRCELKQGHGYIHDSDADGEWCEWDEGYGVAFLPHPQSEAIAAALDNETMVCSHGINPCVSRCGVAWSGTWEVIPRGARLRWRRADPRPQCPEHGTHRSHCGCEGEQ